MPTCFRNSIPQKSDMKGFSLTPKTQGFSLTLKTQGFSLIEMMIVISIMVIVFSLGYGNYREYSARKQLEAAAQVIRNDIAIVKENALSGRKPSGCTGTLNAHRLEVLSNTTYQLVAICSGGNVVTKQQILPYTVTMTSDRRTAASTCNNSAGGFTQLDFYLRGNGTNLPGSDCMRITLTYPAYSYTFNVVVDSSGSVQ
jgi:prepilin-type N-terminal cleavage/methylation domain-containing protein